MQRPTRFLGLLFVLCTAFGPDLNWDLFQVDTQLAVHFPAPPQELDVPRTMAVHRPAQKQDAMVRASQAYVVEDKFARYVLVKIPLAERPTLPRARADRYAYYRKRTIPLLVGKSELLAQTIDTQDGIDLITIKSRNFDATGNVQVKYVRAFTLGKTVYQLHFSPLDKTGSTCLRQRLLFFDIALLPPGK